MTEHLITDERIQQLARQFEQYPDSGPIATLRGEREHTPPALAEWLVELARRSSRARRAVA